MIPHRCAGRVRDPLTGRSKACFARKSLKRLHTEYVRVPACPMCGAKQWMVDKYRRAKLDPTVTNPCYCGALPGTDGGNYPHRKGSSVWCVAHPVGPSQQDYEMRYGPAEHTA